MDLSGLWGGRVRRLRRGARWRASGSSPLLISLILTLYRVSPIILDEHRRLATLVDGDVLARVVAEINLTRARNFLFGIEQKFFPLCNPTGRARNGEEHREHGHGETHGLINQTGIQVHFTLEPSLDDAPLPRA